MDDDLVTSLESLQDDYEGNKDAARALMRVKQKLDGYEDSEMRSVRGQVIFLAVLLMCLFLKEIVLLIMPIRLRFSLPKYKPQIRSTSLKQLLTDEVKSLCQGLGARKIET